MYTYVVRRDHNRSPETKGKDKASTDVSAHDDSWRNRGKLLFPGLDKYESDQCNSADDKQNDNLD